MKCQECGHELQSADEYHPHAFCVLWEIGINPIKVVHEAAQEMGLLKRRSALCEKHKAMMNHDRDYCPICAIEDKYERREALLKQESNQIEAAIEQAINLYPDLEDILIVS